MTDNLVHHPAPEVEYSSAHLIVSNTHGRHRVSISPHIVLHKLHPIVLHILAGVTKCFPILFPFLYSILEGSGEVGEVFFVGLDGLLGALELGVNTIEVFALHQGALGSVGVDPHAVGFVLLPSLIDVGLLCIFCLELFLDRGLDGAFEMRLAGEEGGALRLEICVNLFGNVAVVSSLLVCLKSNGIK